MPKLLSKSCHSLRSILPSYVCPQCRRSTIHCSSRQLSGTGRSGQHVAPNMERIQAPFSQKNNSTLSVDQRHLPFDLTDCFSYYTLSVILATVALSYGSVPMYKMVRQCCIIILRILITRIGVRFVNRQAGVVNQLGPPSIRTPKTLQHGLRP